KKSKGKGRKKRVPVIFAACSVVVVIAVVFLSQGNGTGGAWLADTLRAIVGPQVTAQVESWYLSITNTSSQLQYQASGNKVSAPWKTAKVNLSPTPTPPPQAKLIPMQMLSMTPLINPPLQGEGSWTVMDQAPGKYGYLPLDAKSFIRP